MTDTGPAPRSGASPGTGTRRAGSGADDGLGTGPEDEALAIAERARSCDGVAALSSGPFGTVATYLPGRRVAGVSVNDRTVEIAIVATMDRPLPETADEVRRAVSDLAGERRVDVRIADIRIDDNRVDDNVEGP
ncbi:hypothetical protein AB0L44_19190 [Nonomuraea wenchangensis]|uniref:hypothetical protein n=1 Tax=Nonomuraea wenchangensis TaxID=568860 RepID=UPI0034484658